MTNLAELTVPGPTETALTAPYWAAVGEGRLRIQFCDSCSRWVFYPRGICPHCWADALRWRDASGLGRLKSFCEVWKPGHPGWIPAAPYVVGLVELLEGPTLLSHILNASPVAVGDRVRFAPTRVDGRTLPFFELDLS